MHIHIYVFMVCVYIWYICTVYKINWYSSSLYPTPLTHFFLSLFLSAHTNCLSIYISMHIYVVCLYIYIDIYGMHVHINYWHRMILLSPFLSTHIQTLSLSLSIYIYIYTHICVWCTTWMLTKHREIARLELN